MYKNVQFFKLNALYYVFGINEFTILSGLDIFSEIHFIQHYWK